MTLALLLVLWPAEPAPVAGPWALPAEPALEADAAEWAESATDASDPTDDGPEIDP